jgi:hypothetical protein
MRVCIDTAILIDILKDEFRKDFEILNDLLCRLRFLHRLDLSHVNQRVV